MSDPSVKQIEAYMERHGKRAEMTLKQLGKDLAFVQAIGSPIGQELLKDDVDRLHELLEKIWNESISTQDMSEFRFLKQRINKVSTRLNEYAKKQQEIVRGS
jgi:hypothetical protein